MDEQDCLEKFMLARQGDQCAQEWFERHFRGILRDWLDRHPAKEAACSLHCKKYYLDKVFQDAWDSSFDHHHVEINGLTSLVRYLGANLNGHVLDALRGTKSAHKSFEPPRAEHRTDAQELWERIHTMLPNERERRLGYLLYHCGLKPGEIVRAYPDDFNDMAEIMEVRLTIMRYVQHEIPLKT